MKTALLLPLLALAFVPVLRAQETKPAKPETTEPAAAPVIDQALLDKVSYFYGTRMAGEFSENGVNISVDSFASGLRDALEKKQPKFTEPELEAAMTTFSQAMMAKQQKEMAEAGSKNIAEGEKFLTDNGKREGVTTTASGLQYEVLKKGEGAKPAAADTVSVHYHGTLVNGKVFDSSVQRGEPATFPVGGVIPGWVEALQLMNVGSKYKLFIPSKLAYGERGAGPDITPNSALIFEVELLSIEPKK
jgi:FKBP-type peptidyl-prolyl cis-trans isomerase